MMSSVYLHQQQKRVRYDIVLRDLLAALQVKTSSGTRICMYELYADTVNNYMIVILCYVGSGVDYAKCTATCAGQIM